jgi:type IV pilus assembly protein PilV
MLKSRIIGGQRGAALMEVLVSILITSFGLLALAGLQTKMNAALYESYQRGQALALLGDMTERMESNWNQATNYAPSAATMTMAGTGVVHPADCSGLATMALIDVCEWGNGLLGASQTAAAGAGGGKVGAMLGARGCIEVLQAPNATTGICQPAIYRVTVAWQGFNATVAPAVSCGVDQYGDDALRKAVSSRVVVPLASCS